MRKSPATNRLEIAILVLAVNAAIQVRAASAARPAALPEYTASDAASLEQIFQTLGSAGGTIVLQAGDYRLDHTLNFTGKSHITLEGPSGGGSRAKIIMTAPLTNVAFGDKTEDIHILNIDFVGTETNRGLNLGDAIVFQDSADIEIGGDSFERFSGAVVYVRTVSSHLSRHIWIHDNRFNNNNNIKQIDASDIYVGGLGGESDDPVQDVRIVRNLCLSGGAGNQNYHGILLMQNVQGARIENNRVENKFWHGIVLTNEIIRHGGESSFADVVISGNIVRHCGRVGIYIQNATRIQIQDNETEGNGRDATNGIEGGIFINATNFPGDVTIRDNLLRNEMQEAVKVVGSFVSVAGSTPLNLTIENNRICGANLRGGESAIAAETDPQPPMLISQLRILNNTITGTGRAAIDTLDVAPTAVVDRVEISSNRIYDVGGAGIMAGHAQQVDISNNLLFRIGGHGIFVNESRFLNVMANQIVDWNMKNNGSHAVVLNSKISSFSIQGNSVSRTSGNAKAGNSYAFWLGGDIDSSRGSFTQNAERGVGQTGNLFGPFFRNNPSGLSRLDDSDFQQLRSQTDALPSSDCTTPPAETNGTP